jgi:alkylation response protein AidB-like acyl-CoA dehydrogenase
VTPTLDEFRADAEQFLSKWPLRAERREGFAWGVGSDDVSIFDELDPVEERRLLDEVREWRRQLADAGFAWITGPTEYGGRALPRRYETEFDALTRRRAVPGNSRLTVSLGMIAPTVLAHGTDVAKLRYLRAMYRGDVVACQLFSEPQAGSDLASVVTRAVRDGDGWRVTGQKVWTSGAHLADIGAVLCRTSTGERHRNLTAFIVDMHAPGVDVRPLRQMTGGASFNEVFFEDVWIDDEHRLGDVDGGWRVAMTTLTNERGAIGGGGFGGKGLLNVDRLIALLQHTGRAQDPVTRQDFAQLICGLRTAGWTRQRYAATRTPGAEGSILKLALCRDLGRLAALVSTSLGASVTADTETWGTYAWTNFLLGLPGYRIGGGTDEVLKNVIGERVLGLPKGPGR